MRVLSSWTVAFEIPKKHDNTHDMLKNYVTAGTLTPIRTHLLHSQAAYEDLRFILSIALQVLTDRNTRSVSKEAVLTLLSGLARFTQGDKEAEKLFRCALQVIIHQKKWDLAFKLINPIPSSSQNPSSMLQNSHSEFFSRELFILSAVKKTVNDYAYQTTVTMTNFSALFTFRSAQSKQIIAELKKILHNKNLPKEQCESIYELIRDTRFKANSRLSTLLKNQGLLDNSNKASTETFASYVSTSLTTSAIN